MPLILELRPSHIPGVFFLCSLLTPGSFWALCTSGNGHNVPGTSAVPFGRVKPLWGHFGAFPITVSLPALTSAPLPVSDFLLHSWIPTGLGIPALQGCVVPLGTAGTAVGSATVPFPWLSCAVWQKPFGSLRRSVMESWNQSLLWNGMS